MESIDSKKYYLIDNNIIQKNYTYPFNIYQSSNDKVELLIEKNKEILFQFNEKLYIMDKDKQTYASYLKRFSFLAEKREAFLEINTSIEKFFSNPKQLGNYDKAKEIVNTLIDTMFDENLTLFLMFELLNNDFYSHTHSLNVAILSVFLGAKLNLPKEVLLDLGIAALLHDIGKAKIDKKILEKTTSLSPFEYELVKNHSLYGYAIAKSLGIKNKAILSGIKSHHEKIDGSGYPEGLKDKEIHLFAKIVGICDIFDALISKGTYKDAMSIYESLLLMKKNMANKLDLNIMNQFIILLKEENQEKEDS